MPARKPIVSGGSSVVEGGDDSTTSLRFGGNIYESVALSLRNTIAGDPEASVRALLAPDTLSPSEHKTLVSEWVGTEKGPVAAVLSTITNPLVLIGAALAYKFPVARIDQMMGVAGKLKQYEKWIPGALRGLLGLNEIYTNTPIPKLMAKLAVESRQFVDRHLPVFADALLEWRNTTGRTEGLKDQVRLGALLDRFWEDRKTMSVMRDEVKRANTWLSSNGFETVKQLRPDQFKGLVAEEGDEGVLTAARAMFDNIRNDLQSAKDAAGMTDWMVGKGVTSSDFASWIEGGYFPHVGRMNEAAINRLRSTMIEKMLSDPKFSRMTPQEAWNRMTESAGEAGLMSKQVTRERIGLTPPSFRDLKALEGDVDPEALKTLEGISRYRTALGKPAYYSLQIVPTIEHYGRSVGRGYAWTLKGIGKQLLDEVKVLEETERASGNMSKTELMKSVYLPLAMDMPTFEQGVKAMSWGGVRQYAWKLLDNPRVTAGIPPSVMERLKNFVASDSDIFSWKGAGNKLASMFYLSAMGLNVGSAFQNLLQPIITTAPVLGARATLAGFASVVEKIPEYLKMRTSGVTEHEALTRLFPEFMERTLDIKPLYTEVLGESSAISRTGLLNVGAGGRRGIEIGKRAFMSLFGESERIVRLIAAESAKFAGRQIGLEGEALKDGIQDVVNLTQLWAGDMSIPSALINWSAPARQFLTFPVKLLGLAGASAFNLGGPFNPGTLGRAAMYSAAVYEGVKSMTGADISGSMFFGALPTAEERGPFAPAPVPPALSVLGGAALDLAKGDMGFEYARKNVPLLVPGGLQLARIVQNVSPEISKAIGRSYSDFNAPGLDGTVPTYNADGQLIGYNRPFDLWVKSIGIPGKLLGSGGDAQEQEVFKYALAQRDRMRALKNQYLTAFMEGDAGEADKVNRQYMQLYGGPVPVRPSDWDAVRSRYMVPRIERLLSVMQKEQRQRFGMLAAAALSNNAERFLGMDPELLGVQPVREHVRALLGNPDYIPTGGPLQDESNKLLYQGG